MTTGLEQLRLARTQKVYDDIMVDVMPDGPAAIADFGLRSTVHFLALQHAIRCDRCAVTVEDLNAAMGKHKALKALVDRECNPHRGVVFPNYDIGDPTDDEADLVPHMGPDPMDDPDGPHAACVHDPEGDEPEDEDDPEADLQEDDDHDARLDAEREGDC